MQPKAHPKMKATNHGNDWHPAYWNAHKHGEAWDRVKDALARDWSQTKNDLHAGGTQLNQEVADTVRQALGTERLPWSQVAPAVQFGFGAHVHYGDEHPTWHQALEAKLGAEWDAARMGESFERMLPYVRHGWDSKHKESANNDD